MKLSSSKVSSISCVFWISERFCSSSFVKTSRSCWGSVKYSSSSCNKCVCVRGRGCRLPQALPGVGPLTSQSLSGSSCTGWGELDLWRDVGSGHQGPAYDILHPRGIESRHFHSISPPSNPLSSLSIAQVAQVVASASSWFLNCHTATRWIVLNSINSSHSS